MGPAPTAEIERIPARLNSGVVVNISEAGREAARRRAATPTLASLPQAGHANDVPEVAPRLLNLPTSRSLEANGRISGNTIVEQGTANNAKPALSTTIAKGARPLGQWNAGSLASMKAMRPGANSERMGSEARTATTLSARLQRGETPLGGFTTEGLRTMQNIESEGAKARSATSLSARIGHGEEPLEVSPGRHIVRPDNNGTSA